MTASVCTAGGGWTRLLEAVQPPGTHWVTWNGGDFRSDLLSSGTYIYSITRDGTAVAAGKMLFLR